MKAYEIDARIEYDVTVIVKADSEEAAQQKFEDGDFHEQIHTMAMVNWDAKTDPEEVES